MSVRPVRIFGDPVLKQRAAEVTRFDSSLKELAADMHATMHAYRGVGLAGNQIGVLQRILVVNVPPAEDGGKPVVLTVVNPRVAEKSGTQTDEEGCLSIPGVWQDVTRAMKIVVEAKDEHGQPLRVEAEGYLARALQHEIDHLDGILFVDRLSMLKRQFLRRDLDALARGELPEGHRPMAAGEER